MHWFLWLLFSLFVAKALLLLPRTEANYEYKPNNPVTAGISVILQTALAIGLLVYGGII